MAQPGKALNPEQIRKINQSIAKGNSVHYICSSLGVSKSTVYRQINMDPEQYEAYCARQKASRKFPSAQERPEKAGYRDKLPPDQWQGAEVFLAIVHGVAKIKKDSVIDLDTIKSVWQKRMEELAS